MLPLCGHMENACLLFLAKGQVCFRKLAFCCLYVKINQVRMPRLANQLSMSHKISVKSHWFSQSHFLSGFSTSRSLEILVKLFQSVSYSFVFKKIKKFQARKKILVSLS